MKLVVKTQIRGEHKQYEYLFEKPVVTMGRVQETDIQLPLSTISGFHAQITTEGNDCFVMDRGSVNGTFLNGRRLAGGEKKLLTDGDIIRIQNFDISFWKSPRVQAETEATMAVAQRMVTDVMGSTDAVDADAPQITKSKDHLESKVVTTGDTKKHPRRKKLYFSLAIAAVIMITVIVLLFL